MFVGRRLPTGLISTVARGNLRSLPAMVRGADGRWCKASHASSAHGRILRKPCRKGGFCANRVAREGSAQTVSQGRVLRSLSFAL